MANVVEAAWKGFIALFKPTEKILTGSAAFARSTPGKVMMGAGAATAAVSGVMAARDQSEVRQDRYHARQAAEAAALQRSIAENKARIGEISAELGQHNPTGNFRQAVRGPAASQEQPEIDFGT